MKISTLKGKSYRTLIRSLFMQTLAVLLGAGATVLVLRYLTRGRVANTVTQLICSVLNTDWDSGVSIYRRYIGNRLDTIMILLVIIFFFVFFRLLLSWFTRYFDEITEGVEKLSQESDEVISMSPELEFMETKLNEVKGTLQRRADEIRAAEEKKNELVIYLAHDIKTPLTSVIGYLSLLDGADDMPEEQRKKYTGIALDKAYRLEGLINEFFEITRYNLQSVPLDKEDTNLCYMMVQISDELYPQLAARSKDVEIDIDDDLTVWGDREKLARVFNNILKNAIAYSDAESTINVSAEKTPERLIISFENEGEIPEHKLRTVFEKFYRLDDARGSETGGAGLGLAIAQDIITLHGGQIKADSGQGRTRFLVWLPNGPDS